MSVKVPLHIEHLTSTASPFPMLQTLMATFNSLSTRGAYTLPANLASRTFNSSSARGAHTWPANLASRTGLPSLASEWVNLAS